MRGTRVPSWYLKLDEVEGVRADSGPFGNDFTQNGTVGVESGIIGEAAAFDGAEGNYLSRADDRTVRLGTTFTITGWFLLNSKDVDMSLFSKYLSSDFNFDLIVSYQVADDPGSFDDTWTMNEVNADRIRVHCNGQTFFGYQDFRTVFYANAFGSPPLSTWLFLAFRVRPNLMEISINNTGWDSLELPNSAGMNGVGPMILGAHENGVLPLDGRLDECAKFPFFLSDHQIARIYDRGLGRSLPI